MLGLLAPAPVLSGRILARGTREPLVGAQVRVILDHGATSDTETDDTGIFPLTARPGPCEVVVHSLASKLLAKVRRERERRQRSVLRLQPRLTGDR